VGRALLKTPGVELTGAIDADPAKVGRDLRAVLRLKGTSGLNVSDNAAAELARCSPHVVIHCTGSRLAAIAPQIEMILDAGIPCVTSCEEMAFPEASDPGLAARLDARARAKGVSVLGTGVNPGFVMDAMVLALSGATRDVTHIFVERVLDPRSRRKAFQKKVGLGLRYDEATRHVENGRFGHVGLKQSAMLVARGMGWSLSDINEDVRVLSKDGLSPRTRRTRPRPNSEVIGLQQILSASEGKTERIRMEMVMAAGAEAPHDAIAISGQPNLNLWMQGGIPGDAATVACLINGMTHVLAAKRPGLLTILDLPLSPARRSQPHQGDAHDAID